MLIAPVGLNPQGITEILYALLGRRRPPESPRSTPLATAEVRRRGLQDLVRPRDGWFHRLAHDYSVPLGPVVFTLGHVRVPCEASATPLPDIRSAADIAAMADQVLRFVARLVKVHVDLGDAVSPFAGGYGASV